MKSKFCFILLTLLGFVSLFSIGFASWILVKPMDQLSNNNAMDVLTYELYDNSEYIEIHPISLLQYYNTGFINEELNIVKLGEMKVKYIFNVQDYLSREGLTQQELENESIIIDILLRHNSKSTEQLDFFDGSSFIHSYSIDNSIGSIEEDITLEHSALSIVLNTLPSDNTIEFTVTYKFEYINNLGSDFKDEVFNYIKNVHFTIEARVTRK